jgi:hypothetical protein
MKGVPDVLNSDDLNVFAQLLIGDLAVMLKDGSSAFAWLPVTLKCTRKN